MPCLRHTYIMEYNVILKPFKKLINFFGICIYKRQKRFSFFLSLFLCTLHMWCVVCAWSRIGRIYRYYILHLYSYIFLSVTTNNIQFRKIETLKIANILSHACDNGVYGVPWCAVECSKYKRTGEKKTLKDFLKCMNKLYVSI